MHHRFKLSLGNYEWWSEAENVGMFAFRQKNEALIEQALDYSQTVAAGRRASAVAQFNSGEQSLTAG